MGFPYSKQVDFLVEEGALPRQVNEFYAILASPWGHFQGRDRRASQRRKAPQCGIGKEIRFGMTSPLALLGRAGKDAYEKL